MNAKELRIGNYVYGQWNKLLKQNKGERTELRIIENVNLQSAKKYDFIKINEDWLLKLGFEKHSVNPFWFRKKHLCISVGGKVELISWDMQVFKIDTEIKYVHQLQNLYFALTGEELKIY